MMTQYSSSKKIVGTFVRVPINHNWSVQDLYKEVFGRSAKQRMLVFVKEKIYYRIPMPEMRSAEELFYWIHSGNLQCRGQGINSEDFEFTYAAYVDIYL